MTVPLPQPMSVADYLDFERRSATKHEYVAGDLVAMSGASAAHNIITANVLATIHTQVLQRNCTVFPSDMRLGIVEQQSYFYPDIMVVCGALEFSDAKQDTLLNPTVIIEVLSPSTEHYDRGKKSQFYRTIPSLREYVLIAQDTCYLEHFVRYSEHQWLFTEVRSVQAPLTLAALDCTLPLHAVYAKTTVIKV